MTPRFRGTVWSLPLAALMGAAAIAQTAPVARAVISAEAAPEAVAPTFEPLAAGETEISLPGADWLQLRFATVDLGGGTLRITGSDGTSQSFTQAQIDAYGGLTAIFNGAALTVALIPAEAGPGEALPMSAEIAELVIGLPGEASTESRSAAAPELAETLGADPAQFMAPPPERSPFPMPTENSIGGGRESIGGGLESICGTDNRVAANHPFVGRIMPIGCTGWIVGGGAILTAGHCISSQTETLEFNVPASDPNGATNSPAPRDQYRVVADSIVEGFTGLGNDWAIFRVLPNTETGLTPFAAQGGSFAVTNTGNPANIRITGHGVDGPPPGFGAGGPRDSTNQTQQTHVGNRTGHDPAGSAATIRYTADTQGGNSGGPVIDAANGNRAVGIHTNGGCTPSGGSNAGTSFRNQQLWEAVQDAVGTDDIVWQHRNGQVHYWPVRNGARQGGLDIHSPVGGAWHLAAAGDVDGDGSDDVIWQNRNGQVHYWPIRDGQRQGGRDVHTPVSGNWRLAGAGDVDGDGTDDIVWQHREGQVHYWPMQNGQRQGGVDIHSPVGGDWTLAGVGDLDGDGTDDIVWRHRNGQVHYWPMQAGIRQGGVNIRTRVSGNWRLASVGDVDGDGTDDIVWRNRNGQVHYWPIRNGVRQGGIDIHTPVGGDWRLAAVGNVD